MNSIDMGKITIEVYESLTEFQKLGFYYFCENASKETNQPANVNMWHWDWRNQSNTLPYILEYTNRFKEPNGVFHVMSIGDTMVACGGVYISDFSPNVAILGARTWVHERYRNQQLIRNYILPEQKKWAVEHGASCLALTFNEYNKNISVLFKRTRMGEDHNRLHNREPKHLFYNNFNEVPFPVTIQHTQQYVIYENLSNEVFDWSALK